MALTSAYKNYVGVAKPTAVTVMTTAAIATATSVHVASAAGITTSSTIVIMDGVNTEVRAVSNVTGTVLTVLALSHAHTKGITVWAGLTSGFGPQAYLPLETFKVPDKIDQLYDTARVGSLVSQRGAQQGMRGSEWTVGGAVFADTIGYFLGGITGAVTFTAGTPTPPNTHVFAVNNAGNGQPTKMAWFVYDGVNLRVILGRVTKVNLKWTPKQLLKFSATILGLCSGVISTPTPAFSTIPPSPTWKTTLTIATVFTRTPLSWELTLTRGEAENIPTMNGTQDPLDTFVGDLIVTAKATFAKTADTQLAIYEAGTIQKFVLTLAPVAGATGVGLKVQISKGNYDSNDPGLQGKSYNTEAVALTAVASTTDANTAGGGISPCKITLKDAIGTGKFL